MGTWCFRAISGKNIGKKIEGQNVSTVMLFWHTPFLEPRATEESLPTQGLRGAEVCVVSLRPGVEEA